MLRSLRQQRPRTLARTVAAPLARPSSSSSPTTPSRPLAAHRLIVQQRRTFSMSAPAAKPMEGVESQAAQIIDGNQLAKCVVPFLLLQQIFFSSALVASCPFRTESSSAGGAQPEQEY